MHIALRLALAAVLVSPIALEAAFAQTDNFESLIEDVLKKHGATAPPAGETTPEPTAPLPSPTEQPPIIPPGGAAEPQIVPVEPGPRPYTPPKIARPRGENPPRATAAPPPGAASTPGAAQSPGASAGEPGADLGAAAPTAERTRESLTVEEVNSAVFPDELQPFNGASPLVLKAQVMLDRAGASPGVIDAYSGGNLQKAVAAVETVLGLPADGVLDKAVWDAIGGDAAPPVLVQYQITAEDVAYPFLASIPDDYSEQAKLPGLYYASPEEMLAERFHMDVRLLTALNPNTDFRKEGTPIWVTSVDGPPITAKIARIVADKALKQVRAYDAENRLVVAYPATIGSEETPSPSGDHLVNAVAPDPVYYYDPQNFVQGANLEKLQLPPGPNNPVGTVWIDLTDPGYGIHGTPDPTKIGKTASHGCIRLSNWDAEELAKLVVPGVVVSFSE